jgi:two-component system, OmpR family, sensor kinase
MSLRLRVLAALTAIAIVIGIGAFFVAQTTRTNLEAQLDAQLDSAGELVSQFDFSGRNPGGPPGSDELRQLSTLYLGYIGDNGRLETLFAPDFTQATAALPVIDVDQARREAATSGTYTVASSSSGVRYRVHAVPTGHQDIVLIALPLDTVDGAMSRLIALELAICGISAAVLLLVGWWVIHLGVRPLKSMASAASLIAAGDLSSRVPEAHPATEAGELGVALNTMLERIETSFTERTTVQQRLQQFVADASHELRTPVSTIRGYAELFRQGGLASGAALSDAMRRTEQEAIRMGSLIDDLLLLAKLDEQRPMTIGRVDLSALARDAARDAYAVNPSRVVRVFAPSPAIVAGDQDRLRQVLANLVANAMVHTPALTSIEIEVRTDQPDQQHVVVAVVDHGPGIPAELADRAFERFVRADASRSRDRGGSGLGLAIVDAIVKRHDGSVRIETTPGGGTTMVVTIPAVDAAAVERSVASQSGAVEELELA